MTTDEHVNVVIDGRRVAAPRGFTVIDAAQRAGIRIPALCRMAGFAPLTSCFVCVVRIRGRRGFLPACAARVEEGMEIESDSDEVHAARRTALELLLSDHVGECEAPCASACPAGLDVPNVLAAIQRGAVGDALQTVWSAFPLVGVLGRICPRYCERACRRRSADAAVAIRDIERWVGGQSASVSGCRVPDSGCRVAIVGAGPAGLTAAWFLRRAGHACTVFEAETAPGGLLRFALPRFRLPRSALDVETARLAQIGVKFCFGRRIETGTELNELRRSHDAVVLALGAVPVPTATAGAALERKDGGEAPAESAWTFLRKLSEGRVGAVGAETGTSAAVVGAGSAAVSAARCLVRLGVGLVHLISDKPRRRMTAFPEQVESALKEGVELSAGAVVRGVESTGGGTFRVSVSTAEGDTVDWTVHRVLLAPERRVEAAPLRQLGLPLRDGRVQVNADTGETRVPGVFVAGEMVEGPGAAVRAVASGSAVAVAVDQFVRGKPVTGRVQRYQHRLGRLTDDERAQLRLGAAEYGRVRLEDRPRLSEAPFAETQPTLSSDHAVREAARCLQCACGKRRNCDLRDLAAEYAVHAGAFRGERRAMVRDLSHPEIVWESGKCILCGRCTAIAEKAGERPGLAVVRRGFQARVAPPFRLPWADALSLDTARRCVGQCPTGALAWQVRKLCQQPPIISEKKRDVQ
ncbi:MAG: FAD-dependent oxidoreductase [Kiritimatiellaeota bacterium]|nr:FAD-dependent oxidoreductase [Kiritimatiellota bacterium]